MLSDGTALSGRPARTVRIATAMALAAVLTLASGALTGVAPAAGASGAGSGDDGGYDVTIPLTERTTDELTDGANSVKARGAAEKMRHDGRIYLSLPVRGSDDHRAARGGDHVARLAGVIAYAGAGPNITWSRLRVNYEIGKITAVVNGGPRVAVLRVAGKDHDGHRARNGGDAALKLTSAGAKSLNRAAKGAPFDAGDTYARDTSGCR